MKLLAKFLKIALSTQPGQGRFGRVYTAVNNATGELMAMKEISFQPNDHKAIKNIAEELHIFEGIQHKHLIRYYGVEIHRVRAQDLNEKRNRH